MADSSSPFGRTVKQWRERRSMSRSDLARESGLSYPYVSQLETGLRKPSRDAARKIASALGISVEDLERTIPSDASNREEVRIAEQNAELLISAGSSPLRPVAGSLTLSTAGSSPAKPGSREDLIADMIDLLEEFAPDERLDVLVEVQKQAMRRMLDQPRPE